MLVGLVCPKTASRQHQDLAAFLKWYFETYGHLAIEEWLPRDTQGFLHYLERLGRAATTINRNFASLRHFARWVHEQPGTPFVQGLPTRGIRELTVEESEAKKLSTREVNRLFKAAEMLVVTETRKNGRPIRNRAILALLYFTGLRASELCALTLEQYDGKHLEWVQRKGRNRTRALYISKECRTHLDAYLKAERPLDDPGGKKPWLFLVPNSDKPLSRMSVWRILLKLAQEATKHSKGEIKIHPHRLRHTFGAEVREKTGSDSETAVLLGHTSIKYVGRYARRTEKEREEVLDSLGQGSILSNEPKTESKPKTKKKKKALKPKQKQQIETLVYASEKELRQDSTAERYKREIAAFLNGRQRHPKGLSRLVRSDSRAHPRDKQKAQGAQNSPLCR